MNSLAEEEMYLISIKPKYAYRIFAGVKKYELRRWFGVKPQPGSLMIVYVSGNIRSLIGEFKAGKVLYGTPSKIWEIVTSQPNTGIFPEDKSYIVGGNPAIAIEILEPRLYRRPVTLDEIRRIIPDFTPPLSFRELYPHEPLYRLLIRKLRKL